MDPQSAARLVSALDAELARRWSKRRAAAEAAAKAEYVDADLSGAQAAYDKARAAVEAAQAAVDAADEEEAGPAESQLAVAETALESSQQRLSAAQRSAGPWQSVHVFARLLEWHADNPVPAGVVTESDEPSPDPAEFFAGVREICRKAEMLLDHEEAIARGEPRRRAVIIGPRIRMPYGESRPASAKAKTVDGNGKSRKLSRTEQAHQKAEQERQARQALMLPRPVQSAPPQTELGWHRGMMLEFDQRAKSGMVKFVGLVGISEAEISPDVAIRSGHVNLFRNEKVACRLVRNLDGSVVVADVRMASGANPEATEAAAQERFQVQLSRNKWIH